MAAILLVIFKYFWKHQKSEVYVVTLLDQCKNKHVSQKTILENGELSERNGNVINLSGSVFNLQYDEDVRLILLLYSWSKQTHLLSKPVCKEVFVHSADTTVNFSEKTW